jgi:membrane-associated phospholipid phosphatase
MAKNNGKTAGKRVKQVGAALVEADGAVAAAVEPYRETRLVRTVALLSELGDQPQMLGLCAGTFAAGLARRDARLARAGARMAAAHLIATGAKNFVKRRIDRTRPRADRIHGLKPGRSQEKEETSFPSGHSAGAAAVARAFVREYPEHRTAAYAAAGAIALAQIPRCAHYPTDVGSGLAVGIAAEALVDRLFRLADQL